MAITILRLGSERIKGEGLRLGTVRRPPRGVPKSEFGSRNFYDVWFPNLSPSPPLVKMAHEAGDERTWREFERLFRAEMKQSEPSKILDLLSALSHQTNFSLGCYCQDESRCHRSILKQLLADRGASIAV